MRHAILIPLLLVAAQVAAQGPLRRPVTLSVGGTWSQPQGEFDQVYGKAILGMGGQLSIPMGMLPFESGVAFDWGQLGGEREVVAVDQQYLDVSEGTMSTNSNFYGFHLMGRFKPVNGKVSPYLDGLAGMRSFSARTKLRVDEVDGPLSNERNAHDATWSYGWAAGVMVRLGGPLYLEGRFEKLFGGEVDYVDPETIAIDPDGNVTFDTRRSGTDMVTVQLGIGFRF